MTLNEVIVQVDELRPNHFDKYQKTRWISALERQAVERVLSRATGDRTEYRSLNYDEDYDRMLLIPDAHADVYTTYLFAMMDFANAEMDRYNADSILHNSAWDAWAAEYRRTHIPRAFRGDPVIRRCGC